MSDTGAGTARSTLAESKSESSVRGESMRRSALTISAFTISLLIFFGTSVPVLAAGPSIRDITPTVAPVGGTLTINGSGFGANLGSSVSVNGKQANLIYGWSSTEISLMIPTGATTGNVVVTVGGVKSNGSKLTIVPAPSITGLSPNPSAVGTSITLSGTNLLGGGPVYAWFYQNGSCSTCGYQAVPTSVTNTSVVVQVPPGAITGNVDVNVDAVDSNPLSFTLSGTKAPVADAGLVDTVSVGSTIRLDGTNSYDLNGLTLTYQWSFNSIPVGSQAVLVNPASPSPTFVPDVAGLYVPQLVVNNGSLASAPAFAYIETQNSYPPSFPGANAGPDQTVKVGSTVQLDASGSTGADGLPLSYQWYLWYLLNNSSQWVFQGASALSNPNVVNPTFVASNAGSYFALLSVSDEFGTSVTDAVKISTVNSQPIANAGPAQAIQSAQTVQLDGTRSTDADGNTLTYSWSFLSKPAGSAAALSNLTYPQPTFYADIVGTYIVQLIVNDGTVSSLPGLSDDPAGRTNTVTITNLDVTPLANAGPAQTVSVGSTVNL
jgi:PKD domain/IPT/TIG domain